jgi:5'-3' exonuclease/transcription antitermination factor NusG
MSEWVILELSSRAENEDPTLIQASIRHLIRDAEVFIPASVTQVGEDRLINYLVDGYAFIKRSLPDDKYLRLEGSRYIQAVVTQSVRTGLRSRRILSCIHDDDIAKFKRQIHVQEDQGIAVGDTVTVTSGPYRNLNATVVEDIPERDSVQVWIELRSKDDLVMLPRSFLQLVSKAPTPSYVLMVREHRAWFNSAAPALRWENTTLSSLSSLYRQYKQLDSWILLGRALQALISSFPEPKHTLVLQESVRTLRSLSWWIEKGRAAQAFIRAIQYPMCSDAMRQSLTHLERLTGWTQQWDALRKAVQPIYLVLDDARLEAKYIEWGWLHDVVERLGEIERSVLSVERVMLGNTMIENIVIDGYNMAARCSMAPGLSDLKDSKGRPTGGIVGFLNSVASLKKRYPGAEVWVCWDKPSQRRKQLFAAYKANRNPLRLSFEVTWLMETLGCLGVWQASADGEEADDVMATLVNSKLKDQRNVIVTTDRDMLQLVSDTTHVLVPNVGSSKEKFFTPESVQTEYGVPPENMVFLRALSGDSSDNIPGAPGCGDKTAPKLLKLYGTIDGIYSSNLAGMSHSFRDKLRGAEDQVRLNIRLMALVTTLVLSIQEPVLDQNVVSTRLQDVDVNSSRIIPVFFGAAVSGGEECQQATLFR